MILIYFFIGFFAIFISPQIILYYKYNDIKHSLVLIYGLIISFSASWILFLITFYFNMGSTFLYVTSITVMIYSLFYMYKHKRTSSYNEFVIWVLVLILMMPLLFHIGDGFRSWDAVVSWNRWAVELSNNEYHPLDAAYPILLPSLWSLIYKIQGTHEIWWTAKIALFVLPFLTLTTLLTLYKENKDNAFLFMIVFIYPYLVWEHSINGLMDMPVMLTGTLSLIVLYAAEINKGKKDFEYYIIAALLLAGISSIIKQAGVVFLIFNYVYILLHLKYFSNKKRLMLYIFLSLLYFVSYLSIYYQHHSSVIGNLENLKDLSSKRAFEGKDIHQTIDYLWNRFFSYPSNIPWLDGILKPLKLPAITPFLILAGLLPFAIKKLRKYRSISFMSALFFLIGVVIWIKFFSYDSRNSYWVKSFFILFLSINISYIFTKYMSKITFKTPLFNLFSTVRSFGFSKYFQKITPKYIFFTSFIIIMGYLYSLGDHFAYKKQQQFQSKVGSSGVAKFMANNLLKDKDECLLIYTNHQQDKFNYHAKKVFNKIVAFGGLRTVLNKYNHTCSDGRYFILGASFSPEAKNEWNKIFALEKEGILKVIMKRDNYIMYFAPPQKSETP